jgi:predicted small lipoprotein YifL
MARTAFRLALALTLIASFGLVSFGLAGCGRKSRLEPPPELTVGKSEDEARKHDPGIVKPHRSLPMDFLLN